MNKVCIIASYFPPTITAGVFRPLKFVKYLRRYDWEPVVLTAHSLKHLRKDESLIKDIPKGIKVYYSYAVDSVYLENKLYEKLFSNCTNKDYRKTRIVYLIRKFFKRVLFTPVQRFFHDWVYVPDRMIGWLPFSLWKAWNLVEKEKIEIIYTTSPPHSTQLIGLLIKKLTNKPWIADFRDPWTQNFTKFYRYRIQKKIEEFLEKLVLENADRILVTSRGYADDMIEKYPTVDPTKYDVVANGFDEDDFVSLLGTVNSKDNRFLMTHVGTLYADIAGKFFEAFSELLTEEKELRGRVFVEFVGYLNPEYKSLIDRLGIQDNILQIDTQSHDEAINRMSNSNVLLLFLGAEKLRRGCIPSKLFEYLRAGPPILALAREGEASDIVRTAKAGVVVHPEDVGQIKYLIHSLVKRRYPSKSFIKTDKKFISQFERRIICQKLAVILNQVVSEYED